MKSNFMDIRLRWLMFLRVVIVTFLLGIAAFVQIKGTESLPGESLTSLYIIILLTYFLSFLYLSLIRTIESLEWNIYVQSLADVTLITGLVYVTGGIESIYSIFYPLVIIYSVLFLARRGGIIVASISSIFYSLLLNLEYYGLIQPIYPWDYSYDHSAGYMVSRIFTHIASFYIVAFLASFAVKQEKKVRKLLAEKESAFDQLDLLHKSIIESVDTGILTIDHQENIKSFNKGAEEITNLSYSEVINKKIDSIFPNFSRTENNIIDANSQKSSINRFEFTVSGKILGCSVSPLIDSSREKIGKIIIFRDLTAIREMERQVEKNKRLALVGEMAASLAHEIRNPLASIGGSIQVLERDLDLGETDRRLMGIILRGKDQIENFMKSFLLLARPNPTKLEDVDIEVILDDVLESLRHSPDWYQDIEVTRDSCNQAIVYGSMTELRQVIWNLILNALQSMSEGGRLRIGTRPIFIDEEKYLEILVSDDGCGIEEKDFDKLFDPFYTTKEKGTGLGLAIVNKIMENHQGKIRIESKTGEGTSCIVLLPQSP
jgi:two-component system sensor histidine kinase PilS (NtrC family)